MDQKDQLSYRHFLSVQLQEKKRRNPRLSLSACARDAGLSVSALSRVLSGQRKLTPNIAIKLGHSLKLTPDETQYLLDLIALERARTPKEEQKVLLRISKNKKPVSQTLTLENFRVVADWFHFAILSLAKTKGFKPTPEYISRRLGITPIEARNGLERLLNLGLLEQSENGVRPVAEGNVDTPHDVSAAAVREHHSQHLAKASESMDKIPVELREFASLSVVMNLKNLPEAKQRIRTFLDHFNRDFDGATGEEVVQLNVQMYPLTGIERGRL